MRALLLLLLLAGCGGENSQEISTTRIVNPDGSYTDCRTWTYQGERHTSCSTIYQLPAPKS
jgi:hypothetical protein